MRKTVLFFIIVIATLFSGCEETVETDSSKSDGPAVAVVTLDKGTITLSDIGETETLTAAIMPASAANKTVSWLICC